MDAAPIGGASEVPEIEDDNEGAAEWIDRDGVKSICWGREDGFGDDLLFRHFMNLVAAECRR